MITKVDNDEYEIMRKLNNNQYSIDKYCHEIDCQNLDGLDVYNILSKFANYKSNYVNKNWKENVKEAIYFKKNRQ